MVAEGVVKGLNDVLSLLEAKVLMKNRHLFPEACLLADLTRVKMNNAIMLRVVVVVVVIIVSGQSS